MMNHQSNTCNLFRLALILVSGLFVVEVSKFPSELNAQMIVGHRGASFDAPENTLAAFQLAFEQGADGIEGDFRLTADGKVVCIHDNDTERVANENVIVATSSLEELKTLDVGSWKDAKWAEERIPTLAEVLEVIPDGKKFFIELKTGPEIVTPLVEALEESEFPLEQCVIISFNTETCKRCKELLPEVSVHWLTGYKEKVIYDKRGIPMRSDEMTPDAEKVITQLRESAADGFGSQANPEVFNNDFIDSIKEAGFDSFHVWTVDDLPTASYYQARGAAGITTNRPGFLRKELEAAKENSKAK